MIADIVGVVGLALFLLFMFSLCWFSIKYGGDKYYNYSRKPKDPFYYTSTIIYPKDNNKEN